MLVSKESASEFISQWVVACVGFARQQKHVITACQRCGGPEIWSLTNPESHCFRCNAHQQGSAKIRKFRCESCRRGFLAKGLLKTRYCQKCSRKQQAALEAATTPLNARLASKTGRILRPENDVF